MHGKLPLPQLTANTSERAIQKFLASSLLGALASKRETFKRKI